MLFSKNSARDGVRVRITPRIPKLFLMMYPNKKGIRSWHTETVEDVGKSCRFALFVVAQVHTLKSRAASATEPDTYVF